ncbi:hypothetical protein BJ742DRAFT_286592 [Cladochytrium replicatum]|nr:hypothetical protein BJ742DRAFT_286592 [Cladochytrium replicatum]
MSGCVKIPGIGIIACLILLVNLWTAITCAFRLKAFFWRLREDPPKHVRFGMAIISLGISVVSAGLYVRDFIQCSNLSAEIERQYDLSQILWTPQQLVAGIGVFILLTTVSSIYSFISTLNDYVSKEVPIQKDANKCMPFVIYFGEASMMWGRFIEYVAWCVFTSCATLAPSVYFVILIALRKRAKFQVDTLQWIGLAITCAVAIFFIVDYSRTTWKRSFSCKNAPERLATLGEDARWKFRFFILGHSICYLFFMAPLLWFAIDSGDLFGVLNLGIRLFSGLKVVSTILDLLIIV